MVLDMAASPDCIPESQTKATCSHRPKPAFPAANEAASPGSGLWPLVCRRPRRQLLWGLGLALERNWKCAFCLRFV